MLKAKQTLQLQAEPAQFTNDKGEAINFYRYYVLVSGQKIILSVSKAVGTIGKQMLKDCFE